MATVQVEYVLNVYAFVDTETGEVTKVVEDNDNIQPTGEVLREDGTNPTLMTLEERRDRDKAREIANNAEWPAWERV